MSLRTRVLRLGRGLKRSLAEAAPEVGAADEADLGPEVAADQHVLGGGAVAIVGVVEAAAIAAPVVAAARQACWSARSSW